MFIFKANEHGECCIFRYRPYSWTHCCWLSSLRIGDTGRAIFFQFICFTKNKQTNKQKQNKTKQNWRIFFHKDIPILCKISQEIQIWSEFPYVLWFLGYGQKYVKTKVFDISPSPKKQQHENEAKMKVTMKILGISSILANFTRLTSLVLLIY